MRLKSFASTAFALVVILAAQAGAQNVQPQVSPYAEVKQRIHTTDVAIVYHRPGVKGRVIWDKVVPFGKVWRAGANNTTTFECSTLAAGTYGFHIVPQEDEWTLIFSKTSKAWGSFSYKEEEDALRVTVKPVEAPHREWLQYGFEETSSDSAVCYLHWEKKKVAFKIEVKK